jgi:hypothetical protein
VGIFQKAEHAMATLGERNRSRFAASLTAEKVAEVVETPAASAIVFAQGHEVGEVTKALTKIQHLSKVIFILYI